MINDMIVAVAFRLELLAQFDIKARDPHPQIFSIPTTDPDKPYDIPWIEMPPEVQETLDYQGKIDRTPQNVDRLIALSGTAARTFIGRRAAAVVANPRLEGRAKRDPAAGQA
jgi:NTE family protein